MTGGFGEVFKGHTLNCSSLNKNHFIYVSFELCLIYACVVYISLLGAVGRGYRGSDSYQDRQRQLCLCIIAVNSHFLSSDDDTLTFSILDVHTAVQVTAEVRCQVRQRYTIYRPNEKKNKQTNE